jgi:hypothetical protein
VALEVEGDFGSMAEDVSGAELLEILLPLKGGAVSEAD